MNKSTSKAEILKHDHVQAKVKERAYLIAESEGFPHGKEVIHWFRAEEQIVKEFLSGKWDATVKTAKVIAGKVKSAKTAPKASSPKPANSKPAAKQAPAKTTKPAPKAASKARTAKAASKPGTATNGKAHAKPAAKKAPGKTAKKA